MRDPWRYRCKECESTQLEFRHTAGKETFRGNVATCRYQCNHCGAKNDERKDMKTGELVR